jgi:hypothetical protein
MALNPTTSRGSSSAQPHTQEFLHNAPGESIANGDFSALVWTKDTGDTLLNLTVPTLPTIITSGIYAFNSQVYASTFTVGGYFQAQLDLDLDGADWAPVVTSALATAAAYPVVALPVTMYLTAGMKVRILVSNFDGVAARDFSQATLVQRIG